MQNQDVTPINRSAGRQQIVVLSSPAQTRLRHAGRPALQSDRASDRGDDRTGRIVGDHWRYVYDEASIAGDFRGCRQNDLALVEAGVDLLYFGQLQGVGG